MIVTKNLKMFRVKYGLYQEDIAAKLNISTQSYRQKENGIRPFTLEEAKIISELFLLPIETIFFDEKVYIKETTA